MNSRISMLGALTVAAITAGCEAPAGSTPTPESKPTATAAATAVAAKTGGVFDPNNPPPGWTLCHRNHCHHEDGRVASYAQVMQETGLTSMVGGQAKPAAPPAPADVSSFPMDADRTSSGLVTRVLKPGTGKRHPKATSVVTVHYTGWTTDGNSFDSSITRGQPSSFPLNRVIPGWTEGMQLMVEGEERRFWIPESIAYAGKPGKPKGTLVFDVELISFKDP